MFQGTGFTLFKKPREHQCFFVVVCLGLFCVDLVVVVVVAVIVNENPKTCVFLCLVFGISGVEYKQIA